MGDCFGTLVYEPTWNGPSAGSTNPAVGAWTTVNIDQSNGLFWWTGGFGQPNTTGGPPLLTLVGWKAALSSDFGDAVLFRVSVGVGSFNQGQIGYFDNVIIAGTNADASYDFEPAPLICVQPPPGMVSWWPGDSNTDDIVGGNDGTLLNGATFAAGQVDQAFSFNGSSEVTISDHTSLDVQAFTIDAWVFPTVEDASGGVASVDIIVNKESTAALGSIQYEIGRAAASHPINASNLAFFIGGISGLPNDGGSWVDGGGSMPLNAWTHVALTFDGSMAVAYINGGPTASFAGLTGTIPNTTGPFRIGARSTNSGNFSFTGLIDEVEIFGRALSDSKIQAIFDAGSAGKCKVTTVDIDIKPGSDPNCFNINGHGVILVAILGSETFDVTLVDPLSLSFGGLNVRVRGKRVRCATSSFPTMTTSLIWFATLRMTPRTGRRVTVTPHLAVR